MAFHAANMDAITRFNSATSNELLDKYESYVYESIQNSLMRKRSKSVAPSAFRCARKCWFRLQGSDPDFVSVPDITLNHTAEVGTSRHLIIQKNLSSMLKDDWIDVSDYLESIPDYPFDFTITKSGMESQVAICNPPVRFACDGIIRLNNKIYLLEIKTTEYSSWEQLTQPKAVHLDQIKLYGALLHITDVIMLYEDRQYGNLKCYEVNLKQSDIYYVLDRLRYIQEMVDHNLAPDRLDAGDYMCKNCEYQKKCSEWG